MATKVKTTKKRPVKKVEALIKPSDDVKEESKTENGVRRRVTKGLIAALLIVGVSLLVYQYVQTRNELQRARDPKAAAKTEATDLAKKIGKYLDLPQNERPTTATVSDKTKLQDQPFFEHVQDGDKVLVYTKAQRAVLYRPSTNKIIEYAPVNLSNN